MSTYLVHFNQNHDRKNGRFTYGDGDGDGIVDDHANQKKETSAGGKIGKAVEAYDNARDYVRSRQAKEDQYQLSKAKRNLEKERVENLRNAEQNDIKSRNINTSMQKEQAKADKAALRLQTKEQRAEALINDVRRKTEKDVLRSEAAEARARALLAKQELRNMKLEAKEAKRAQRAAEKAAKQERRDLINQAKAAEKAQKQAVQERVKSIQRYNDDLQSQADRYNAKASKLIKRATAFTLTGAIGGAAIDGIRAAYYRGKANDILKKQYQQP